MTAKDSKRPYMSHFDTFSLSWIIHDHLTSLLGRQVTCCPTSLKLALGAWPSDIWPERRCWKIFQRKERIQKGNWNLSGSTDIHLLMEEHLSFFQCLGQILLDVLATLFTLRISHHLGLQIGLAVQIGCLNVHLVLGAWDGNPAKEKSMLYWNKKQRCLKLRRWIDK